MNKWPSAAACCLIGLAACSTPALASPASDALSNCLAENTTGKDRKELAQWVFVAMTAHPEIKPLSNVPDARRDEHDKKFAALATRLMTETCRAETKAAMQEEGTRAIEAAFGVLGQLAMQELMSNPAVNASFTRYAKYLDNSKFEAAFK